MGIQRVRCKTLLILTLLTWPVGAEPSMGRRCQQIRQALPVIKRLSVKVYRCQNWCRCFQYKGGAFMQSSHESTCALFNQKSRPFTPQAQADFVSLRKALAGAGVIWLSEREGGFDFALEGFSRRTLIYQPHYRLPPDEGHEFQYRRVDQDFYLALEDWN